MSSELFFESTMKYELVATATFGLEAVVRREIEALGFRVLGTEDGRVIYEGDEKAVVRSNLWLRSADRVYIKMGTLHAETFEDLYQSIKAMPWEEIIPPDGKIIVTGTSVKSTLHSVPACQSICNKAIVDRLMEEYGVSQLPETGATYPVRFSFLKNQAIVLIDTSGEGLHKRGYRVSNVAAPIKETLAAAMIELSFWKPGRILIDPCCGSGTIGIEAALIGLNIAPGLSRKFVSEEWNIIDDDIWKAERKACYEVIDYDNELDITIGDIDPKAIAAAKKNAEEAGVDDKIRFVTGDMAALQAKGDAGIIICNPPYGERIGEAEEIAGIYESLKAFLTEHPDWSLFMVTSDKGAEQKVLGRPANRRRKLYNGRIETCYYQFHGDKPKKE